LTIDDCLKARPVDRANQQSEINNQQSCLTIYYFNFPPELAGFSAEVPAGRYRFNLFTVVTRAGLSLKHCRGLHVEQRDSHPDVSVAGCNRGFSHSDRQLWCEVKSDFIVVIPIAEKLILD